MTIKPLILVVEDNQTLLKTMVKLLHHAQYFTLQAVNGLEALRVVDESKPDLVLLSADLPDLNGFEVCRRIKTSDQKNTIVILISGLSKDSENQAEALEIGADGYLVRPISDRELMAHVKALLRIQSTQLTSRSLEERNRSIYENLPLAYQSLDESGCFLDVNKRWLEALGYTRHEVIGKWFGDFLAPAQKDLLKQRFSLFKERGEVRDVDFEMVAKDGSRIFVTFNGKVGYDSHMAFKQTHCVLSDITERKKVEIALKESEEKFRHFFESANVGKSMTAPTGEISVNQAFADMLGYEKEELANKTWQMLTPHEDIPSIQGIIDSLLKGEKHTARFTKRYIHKNGSYIWADVSVAIQRDFDGKPLHFITTVVDITERKRAEEIIRESETRLELFFTQSLDGFFFMMLDEPIQWDGIEEKEKLLDYVFDHQRITKVNDAMLSQYGATRDQFLGSTPRTLFAHDIEYGKRTWREFLDKGQLHIDTVERKMDGSQIWIEGDYICLYNEKGQITGHFGIQRDITARKNAEEQLLVLSKRQQAILAAIPDILMEVDANKVYTWANPAGIQFFGEDVIGHTAENYFMGEEEVYKAVQPLFEGNENTVYIESWQRRFDGEKRLLAWWCRVLKGENGDVTGALSTARDITEIRLVEEEIKALNAELELRVEQRTKELTEAQDKILRQEKLAVLGQMAGGVGHELRNPLGVISNAIYFLKMLQPEMDMKVKQYIEMIETETLTAEKIITDLLEFGRFDSVVKEIVSASDMIEYALSRRPAPLNITVTKDLPADLPRVNVDPRQINQILENLVVNAFQAMPEGGRLTIHGEIEEKIDRSYISLSVGDTGSGISKENMRKLFEPLFTTKPRGIGLGLAVCRKLIEANDGWIEVQSEEGKGSLFTIHLPAATPDEPSSSTKQK